MNRLCLFKIFLMFCCASCSDPQNGSQNRPTETKQEKLTPDRINCSSLAKSNYILVIIFKDPQLPEGVTAIGLKNEASVIFTVATQKYLDESHTMSFIETPATESSKEVKFYPEKKTAKLLNFQTEDLPNESLFSCNY